jgi:hypothetical protein
MTLLNAPAFDAQKERKNRNLLIGAGVVVLLAALIGVGGFLLGHGWIFDNLAIEHHVGTFLEAVKDNQLEKAYGIWVNDPNWQQHPQNPNYDFTRFKQDWGPESPDQYVKSYKVDVSVRKGSGCVVGVKLNGRDKPLFLWYEPSTGKMTYSPLELQY